MIFSSVIRTIPLQNRDNKVDKTVNPLDEPSPKKVKTHMSSSMKAVSEKASVLVEYAKSGRSTFKGCSENIAKGALRLVASAHDPRGYDSTKWYHVACFPTSSYPIFPVENLKGFDSVKVGPLICFNPFEFYSTYGA